jgi:hypothetical protein
MLVIATIPAAVSLLGILLWALGPEKSKPPALHMFWTGLLVFLFTVSGHTVKIG